MKTNEEILETYGTVATSRYGVRWYLKNDHGRATGGAYYRQEATDVMLDDIRKRMFRKVTRLENRSENPWGDMKIVKFADS